MAAAVAVTVRVIFIFVDLTGTGITTILARIHPLASSGDDTTRRGDR